MADNLFDNKIVTGAGIEVLRDWVKEREPNSHASTHSATGSDPITISQSQVSNLEQTLQEKASASDVASINEKISSVASSTNKLVSASEMGDAIEAVEARQIYKTNAQGSFATKAELIAATVFYLADGSSTTPTKNDVVYVLSDETHNNKSAKYVLASETGVSPLVWGFVITFSDATFTQSQMDAINSGATSEKIAKISTNESNISALQTGKVDKETGKGLSTNDYDNTEKQKVADNTTARHTHSNKSLLDSYNQSNANLSDAVTKKHEHLNKTELDGITAEDISNWDSSLKADVATDEEVQAIFGTSVELSPVGGVATIPSNVVEEGEYISLTINQES